MSDETKTPSIPQTSAKNDIAFGIALLCGTALFLAVLVWPTPYFYERLSTTRGDYRFETLYRVNRFTGATERIADAGPPAQTAPAVTTNTNAERSEPIDANVPLSELVRRMDERTSKTK